MKHEKRDSASRSHLRPRPSRVRAKKSLGQNFLVDDNVIAKIISALDPRPRRDDS